MSKIQMMGRPFVVFDVHNKDHRRWYAEFNARSSWGHCPVRFVIDDDAGDLITMIQRRLVTYYIDSEFGKKRAKLANHNPVKRLTTKPKGSKI